MDTNTISTGAYTATLQGRQRRATIFAARYEAWLLEQYPEAKQARMAVLSLPNPPPGDLAAQSQYQRQLTGIQVQLAEGYEQAAWIAQFAVLAVRLQEVNAPAFQMQGSFEREALSAAYLDYLSEEDNGFWTTVEQAIRRLDVPLAPADESGADFLGTVSGSGTSSAT